MKKLLLLRLMTLFVGVTTISGLMLSSRQDRAGEEGIRNQLVGAWRLAWLEEAGADGKFYRADCTGLLVYTRDGHMSVQVMYRNPQAGTQAGPVQYAHCCGP
jgi:Lipocalin-like domain